jgi:type IV pilus assembly protein PilA
MSRLLAKKKAGFTLLELMIVVAILGILAAVAIPAFMTYIKRSRTSEANVNVEKMFTAAATYYSKDWTQGAGATAPVETQCLVDSIAQSPANPGPQKVAFAADLNATAMGFTIADPVYFGYSAVSSGAGCGITAIDNGYTFYGVGDLDGDDTDSSFSQASAIQASLTGTELMKSGALYVQNELE